uniref:Uncharacterized protein n=1 Tax=Sphaerodactylus townsendi TaxID=933632 RepID=A0ACB8EP55_9SAUR
MGGAAAPSLLCKGAAVLQRPANRRVQARAARSPESPRGLGSREGSCGRAMPRRDGAQLRTELAMPPPPRLARLYTPAGRGGCKGQPPDASPRGGAGKAGRSADWLLGGRDGPPPLLPPPRPPLERSSACVYSEVPISKAPGLPVEHVHGQVSPSGAHGDLASFLYIPLDLFLLNL